MNKVIGDAYEVSRYLVFDLELLNWVYCEATTFPCRKSNDGWTLIIGKGPNEVERSMPPMITDLFGEGVEEVQLTFTYTRGDAGGLLPLHLVHDGKLIAIP